MAINKLVLLTIVSNFIAYGHTAPEVLNDEFTLAQLEGEWLDIGRISTCSDITLHSCITHSIVAIDHDTYDFMIETIPYEKIPNCDRGVPINPGVGFGNFVNAQIFSDESDYYSGLNATIKSYNDGKELILTEAQNESSSGMSYRLWSREREVSAETKAEFEKLAGNGIVEYFPWDNCPIVRSEIHEAPVDLVHDGLWYDIAKIAVGDDNSTCSLSNMTVNHANNTIDEVNNSIENGKPYVKVIRGHLSKFGTVITIGSNEGNTEYYDISCNKGEHLITVGLGFTYIHLSSRNQTVPAETLAEFRRVVDIVKQISSDMVYTTYSYDNCPK